MKNQFELSSMKIVGPINSIILRAIRNAFVLSFLIMSSCGDKPDTDNSTMGAEPSFKDRDKAVERMTDSTNQRDDHSNDTMNQNLSTQPKQ